ncbi:MAG: sortase [Anaerolineaceae bacterium]|nr:sortase [Anaerolineaceae bacterium]
MKTSIRYQNLKFGIHFLLFASMLFSLLAAPVLSPAEVKAQVVVLPAQMNKSFLPISIIPGEISTLEIEIFNPNLYELTSMSWIDDLTAKPVGAGPEYKVGVYIADVPNNVNTCGGTVTAVPGATEISLTGGTVEAATVLENGSCFVRVDVSAIIPGNLFNYIPVGALTATGEEGVTVTNTDPVEESLNVTEVQAPSISKQFAPNTVWVGQRSELTINVRNNDAAVTLTEVSLVDTLPAGVEIADPVGVSFSNCGTGTVTAPAGGDTITLNDATIVPGATCQIVVDVVSFTDNAYTNQIPEGNIETGVGVQTKQGVTNGSPASAELNVQAVGIEKAFLPATINAGETSVLTITLLNPTGGAYTGANLSDVLPGTVLEVVNGSAATTCTLDGSSSSDPLLVFTTAPRTVSLTGGYVPAGDVVTPGSCTITVTVQAPLSAPDQNHNNTIPVGALTTDQGITNATQASATLRTEALSIDISKNFSPDRIQAGGVSTLTITLRNESNNDYTNVGVTDNLPTNGQGLQIASPANESTTCVGGTVTANAGDTSFSIAGATVPANGSCTFQVDIFSPDSGGNDVERYTNTIPANTATSAEGVTNLQSATDYLDVYEPGEGVTGNKSFYPSVITAGENTRLQIRIYAPEDQTLTSFYIRDILPAGIYITNSSSHTLSGCGSGVLTAATGATEIILTGGTINAGGNCRIRVWVTSDTLDQYTNQIEPGHITNDQGETIPANISANLRVTDLTTSKEFYPTTVSPGGFSTLTITLRNTNDLPLVDVILSDYLSSMGGGNVVIAPVPNTSTTCPGGTITATAGEQLIQMTGGSVPSQVSSVPGICTISVDVQGNGSAATRTNTLERNNVVGTVQGTTTQIIPVANSQAQLTIRDLSIEVVKGFQPSAVFGGSSSTMSIELINPNTVDLIGIALVDNMPAGMYIATPPNFDVGVCGGTLVGNPGDGSFTFNGGFLPAGGRCVLRLSATMNVNGNLTNTIHVGEVTSFNGADNDDPTSTTLTNLPGVSVIKYFNPSIILGEPGNYSTLTIEIENRTNIPLNGMRVIDNLPGILPAGLFIAGSPAPAPTTDCGGTLDAVVGSQHIELVGGALIAYEVCTIEVPISSTVAGEYVNKIPKGTIVTDEGATNKVDAEDTLTVHASPEMQISKDVSNIGTGSGTGGVFVEGDSIIYDITVRNAGDISLSTVTVTDPGIGVILGSCTPANGSTLAAGTTMICTASHVVTAAEVAAGEFTNTAYADSDQTNPFSDNETVPLTGGPALSVNKVTTSNAPYGLGDTITYEITVRNIGTTILNNVLVTDPGTGVVLGTCTPVLGSSLAAGDSMICGATHVVTQVDVDAGAFTNTAFGDSNETEPESDMVTVSITENPKLKVYKEVITDPPYVVGDTVAYEIIVLNSGNQTLTNVTVTDVGAGVTMGTCDLSDPVTLNVNEYMTCSATYIVEQADFDNGSFTNTAVADSVESEPAEGSAVIEFVRMPAIALTKTGTLNMDVLAPADRVDAGDTITYEFTVRNTGNVTLSNVTVADTVGGVTISGGPILTLGLNETDSTTFTGIYTLTQADVDAGTFTNTATATGEYPGEGNEVTGDDNDTQNLADAGLIGVAKRVVGDPVKVSAGTWDVTYEILVRNYGNVTMSNLQVTDDFSSVFADPTVLVDIIELSSNDFTVNWPGFDGIAGTGDTNMLEAGTNSLAVGASGTITVVVRVIPANSGPFDNTANATADNPAGQEIADVSQDGENPDPEPSDGDPTNNNEPTPLDFGPNLFDPPFGVKLVDSSGVPYLTWTMIWINDTNIVAINAEASDEIPFGTTFEDTGISSGYPLPTGVLPVGSTNTGVICDEDGSTSTTTTYCYYEGITVEYPRGRIVWVGTLGPDLGATTPEEAVNDIAISFNVRVNHGVNRADNRATLDADLNGDGDINDPGETIVAEAEESWLAPEVLPETGFAPGIITKLPVQPVEKSYGTDALILEIPDLDLSVNIVTVPIYKGDWDVTWLGDDAGYLTGSAYPTWSGNTVITAHNWTETNHPGPFANLNELHYGDQVEIHAFGATYVYEVRETRLVSASNIKKTFEHKDYDWLTLMTCESYDKVSGEYLFRRLVRAVLIEVIE